MTKLTVLLLTTLTIFAACTNSKTSQKLEIPPVFADNMVIQREKPIKIWGKAKSNKEVTIAFKEQQVSTKTLKDGSWNAELKAEKAGGPFEFLVISDKDTITLSNVMIGDVWICSGQSNMDFNLKRVQDAEKYLAEANNPNIRLFHVEHKLSLTPEFSTTTYSWHECNPDSAARFSAVGYFLGHGLNKELNIPIGIIQSSFGGSLIEAWISGDSLKNYKEFAHTVELMENNASLYGDSFNDSLLSVYYDALIDKWEKNVLSILNTEKDYTKNYLKASDISDWKIMSVPGRWETKGLEDFDGIIWFTKNIEIPKEWVGQELTLKIGSIDDIDITYFNETKVGSMLQYNDIRNYDISADFVKSTSCKITVQAIDVSGGGGFSGNKDDMYLVNGDDSIALAGKWNYKIQEETVALPKRPLRSVPQHIPSGLYNGMLYNLIPFSIKGAVWYQGESNADRPYQYRSLMKTLINNWRAEWQDDFAFIIIQLPNYSPKQKNPAESDWAEIREAQFMATELEGVEITCNIDLGLGNNIHPTDKKPVGDRLVKTALACAYGQDIRYSGPRYKSVEFKDSEAIIEFTHVYDGFKTKGSRDIKGFSIAGTDKVFYWADAKIEDGKVIVSSPKVLEPSAVRYGWANNPDVTLYNSEELPTFPFRTDNWDGVPKLYEPTIVGILNTLLE